MRNSRELLFVTTGENTIPEVTFQINFHPITVSLSREKLLEYLEAAGWDREELSEYTTADLGTTILDNIEPDEFISDLDAEVPEASDWSIRK
jgi:hypothetical protein